MNNIEKLLLLLAEHKLISLEQIMQTLNLGKRSVQDALRHARLVGKTNGFRIDNIKNKGYLLVIENAPLFHKFQHELNNVPAEINTETRINLSILFLIQNSDPDYVTYDEIADYLAYPRSTVVADKNRIEKIIAKYHCFISSKSHYGLQLIGDEQCKRKLMFEIYATDPIILQAYERELLMLKEWVKQAFSTHAIYADEYLLHSVTLIITIILIRKDHPFHLESQQMRQSVYAAVETIFGSVTAYFDLMLPQIEVEYAAQVISKIISSKDVNRQSFEATKQSVAEALMLMDQKYHTDFHAQAALHHDLSYHTHALLKRKSVNYSINNPLQPDISPHYTASLQLARTFIDVHPQLSKLPISKYDIYLISLFFRTAFEKYKHDVLSKTYHINYISQSLMSFTKLNVQLLQSVFPNSQIDINGDGHYDWVFYTQDAILPRFLDLEKAYIIRNMLNQEDLRKIKRDVILKRSNIKADRTLEALYQPLDTLIDARSEPVISLFKKQGLIPLSAYHEPLLSYENIHLYTDILDEGSQPFITFEVKHKTEINLYLYLSMELFYLYYDLDIVCDFIMQNLNTFLSADSQAIAIFIKKTIDKRNAHT
ncbi:MAG TPA: PRD domain-containing protein [Erysipelothrix sp.]